MAYLLSLISFWCFSSFQIKSAEIINTNEVTKITMSLSESLAASTWTKMRIADQVTGLLKIFWNMSSTLSCRGKGLGWGFDYPVTTDTLGYKCTNRITKPRTATKKNNTLLVLRYFLPAIVMTHLPIWELLWERSTKLHFNITYICLSVNPAAELCGWINK